MLFPLCHVLLCISLLSPPLPQVGPLCVSPSITRLHYAALPNEMWLLGTWIAARGKREKSLYIAKLLNSDAKENLKNGIGQALPLQYTLIN